MGNLWPLVATKINSLYKDPNLLKISVPILWFLSFPFLEPKLLKKQTFVLYFKRKKKVYFTI